MALSCWEVVGGVIVTVNIICIVVGRARARGRGPVVVRACVVVCVIGPVCGRVLVVHWLLKCVC